MAKIENTTVYPLTTPSADDFIIGTDTSDDNRTVSFSISTLTAAGGLQGLQSVLDTSNVATGNINLTGNITVNGTVAPSTITAGATTGTAGQVLSSTGTGLQWIAASAASCCSLDDTLTVGNSTAQDINTTGNVAMSGAGTSLAFTGGSDITLAASSSITTEDDIILGSASVLNLNATSVINDATGAVGSIGQILTVNAAGTGVEWSTGVPVASIPTLQQVLTAGDTAVGNPMNLTSGSILTLDAASNIISDATNTFTATNTFSANGTTSNTAGIGLTGSLWDGASTGTAGQVLTSTATGVSWGAGSVGTQNLQSVLGLGNTATNDINLTGSIIPTTITDGVASVGASAQYLSSTGTGLAWATLPAALVSSVGFSNTGVTSLGPPIVISPTAGNVVIEARIYGGGSLQGYVPPGGNVTEFLQGDGTWAVPGGGAVTSVTKGASAASTGATDAISVTPTTGAVVVTSNSFAGADRVGHVPDAAAASSTTAFLRADGTWALPDKAPPEWVQTIGVGTTKVTMTGGDYYMSGVAGAATVESNTSNWSSNLSTSPPSTASPSDGEHAMSMVYANSSVTGCTTSYPNHTLCDATIMVSAGYSDTFSVTLWKGPLASHSTYQAVPAAQWTEAITATNINATKNMTVSATGTEILEPGYGFFATVRAATGGVQGSWYARIVLKFSGSV